MSEQQPRTQTKEYPPKKDLLLQAMLSLPDIFGKVVKPVSTKSDVKQRLNIISEYVILVSTDESLLTADGIVLRNTFLKICPNIPNFQQPPTQTKTIKPTHMELLTRILGDPRLVKGFTELFKTTNIHELTPDAKKLLDDIWLDPRLFSECVRLVSTDESLLTADGIVLRNTFLEICPNIQNLL